MESDKSNFSEM